MNIEIPLNRIGKICSGEYKGWQVKVEKCAPGSENCLVLISKDFSIRDSEGYDDWLEDFDCLQAYFEESGWLITWQ